MKLYVETNKGKRYLPIVAPTRLELYKMIGSRWFALGKDRFEIHSVKAENDSANILPGVIIGGVLGLLAGPIGVLGGGTLGGLIGNSSDNKAMNEVRRFNNSAL